MEIDWKKMLHIALLSGIVYVVLRFLVEYLKFG
jgi:hypothetical protein